MMRTRSDQQRALTDRLVADVVDLAGNEPPGHRRGVGVRQSPLATFIVLEFDPLVEALEQALPAERDGAKSSPVASPLGSSS
jgi:hypothetical protein